MASKHSSAAAHDATPGKRARVAPSLPKIALNRLDCNLDFTIELDGITGSALCYEGFAYCWSGARANIGVKGGKYCFGCKVLENQAVSMEDTAKDQQNVCRVGISRGDNDVGSLGESANSFGYGGTGKFSHSGVFTDYGEKFSAGDTIICAVDLQNPSRAQVSFTKNGKWLGVGKVFDAGPKGADIIGATGFEKAILPHILLKNVKVRIMLSIDHGLEPLESFKPWECAVDDGNAVEGPKAVDGTRCEVIMMVGLPGSGKTTWAERWAREHPEKRYMLLGTNFALDQMKVPGLMRKRNYGERFERLMDRASKIFNQLMARASKTSRNFIIDQTNVYRTARVRKLKPFSNFHKVAVVVFPHPEELKRRTRARTRDMGKEVPEEAVHEMLANFVLPNSKEMLNSVEPFDEVRFIELQRSDADRHLAEMKSAQPAKPLRNTDNTPASSFQGSFHDQSVREGSNASMRGSYSSAYELQDHNVRKPAHMPVLHPALSQVPYGSASRVSYASASAPQTYEGSHLILDRSSYAPPQSYPPGQVNVSLHGAYQGSVPRTDHYARESFHYDGRQDYSRESALHSYAWTHLNPYAIPSQAPYGPRSGIMGHDMPGQTLDSAALAGGYAGGFAGNAGRQLQSQTSSQYGDSGISSNAAGQAMPSMQSYYRY